jgi:hypothetical protein
VRDVDGIRQEYFTVKSIRPAAQAESSEVPEELRQAVEDKMLSLNSLEEELGIEVKSSNLYHGGESGAVIVWHGQEYVLELEPVP